MSCSRIVVLAREIEKNTVKIDEYLKENNLPSPSFEEDGPLLYQFPAEISAAQEALSLALDELWWLNQGAIPTVFAKSLVSSIGLKTIIKYDIHHLVPLETGTTFSDLANKTGLPVKKLTRLLRHGMTDHLFREPTPGHIKHTIATKALVLVPPLKSWCGHAMNEMGPAMMRTVDAVDKWPNSEEPNNSGFQLANNTDKPFFTVMEDNSDREIRFKSAMSFLQSFPGMESSYVLENFHWASLGKGVVVDVGGSHGLVSFDIARKFPDLHLVVQDLPSVIEDGRTKMPDDLAGRLEFMAHDFFTEQPVKNADVYYFRTIFHDWSDKYCIKILRALIPALKPGARIVISDKCLAATGSLPALQERWERDADIAMMAVQNAQERNEDDWKDLFKAADVRFKLEEIKIIPDAKLDIIVVRWE